MAAKANGRRGAPIKAPDEAKTVRLSEDGNDEWRPTRPVPSGLLRKWPRTVLRKLAGRPVRFRPSRNAIFAVQRIRSHSVNRPQANPPFYRRLPLSRQSGLGISIARTAVSCQRSQALNA